jgi:hypothetical protein
MFDARQGVVASILRTLKNNRMIHNEPFVIQLEKHINYSLKWGNAMGLKI